MGFGYFSLELLELLVVLVGGKRYFTIRPGHADPIGVRCMRGGPRAEVLPEVSPGFYLVAKPPLGELSGGQFFE